MSEFTNTQNPARAVTAIAMSGGIDSSVAAFLMKRQGYDCMGITLELTGGENSGIDDAREIARFLNIPYHAIDLKDAFDEEVIKRFVSSYIKGNTPNPCVDCNRFIKFGRLFKKAEELGCNYIATGHYAQIEYDNINNINGSYLLKKGVDEKKDQSYVLYSLTQAQLAHIKFPLGSLTKTEVRRIAEEQGFVNAHKKESQDICFVENKNENSKNNIDNGANGDYAGFIENYTGKTFPPGDFLDTAGNILGRHNGIIRYTTGQRRGLGLALKHPMYVQSKCAVTNTVILCTDEELHSKSLTACDINIISGGQIHGRMKINAKVRYNQKEQPAVVEQTGEDELHIEFDSPQRAVTKGQAVVLYDGDIVVGGGTIV